MKKIFLIVLLIGIYATLQAQDANYNGPAKVTVKAFWDGATKLEQSVAAGGSNLDADRLAMLSKKIKDVKAKDASYDTAAMEAKLTTLTQVMDQAKAQKEKEQEDKKNKEASDNLTERKITSLLEFLFGRNNDNLNRDEMKAKTDEMLALDRSGYTNFEIWIGRLKQKAEGAQQRYPKQEAICKEESRAAEAQKWYRVFQSYQSYWDAAQKVFPGEESFKKTYSLITSILNGLGTEENLLKLVAKNYGQKVKDTRLPAAKVKDAALEKLFMDAYDKMYGESHKGKAIKAIIVSDDWQIQRNEVTGIVTGRLRKGAVVYKNAEGQCRLIEEFFIQQEYVGNSFIGTKSVYAVGKGQEMLCEFVK